ncbi:MAG: hypothetical protein KAV87_28135 [Desulfobacteraceae bacterium]|nr:hypothetical protein [Desulfobacteraceae bacterium]
MDVTLMNPTNEPMEPLFGGKPIPLLPGAKIRVDGSIGNHIINTHGLRGIISLDYDDDKIKSKQDRSISVEEWKIKKGKERNREFKEKQILLINQQNEKRKHEKMSYLDPTQKVKDYAKELGLELLSPYTATDKEQVKLNEMKEENLDLREQNLKLQEQNGAILSKLDQLLAGKTVSKEEVATAIEGESDEDKEFKRVKNTFWKLGKDNFVTFCKANEAEMKAWPEKIKTLAREKHSNLGLGELVI